MDILKTKELSPILLVTAAVLMLGTFSIAKTESDRPEPNQQPAPAGVLVKEAKSTAMVEAINYENREVTLKMADGSTETFIVGKQAVNFDQIKVGDQINTTYLESMVVNVQKAGGPRSAGTQTTISLAPKGAQPKAVVTNTVDLNATVDAVDPQKHTITVTGVLGKTRTMKVDPKVDLTNLKTGDNVAVRYTEAVVMELEKPSKPKAPEANTPAAK